MKKTLLITMLALLGLSQAVAQEYEYVPFVREGVKWVYYYNNQDNPSFPADPNLAIGKVYLTLEIKGDALIGGKSYKKMHKYFGDAINEEIDTVPIYLREEDKIVYAIVPDGKTYPDCPIGNLYDENIFDLINNGQEFVLYDFQDPIRYWDSKINVYDNAELNTYESLYIDTIAVGNHLAKRYVGTKGYHQEFKMIEGIGVDSPQSGTPLFPFRPMFTGGDTFFAFSHVIENNEIVYKCYNYDPNDWSDINEVVADQRRSMDDNYYDLMGRTVGKDIPTTPGIYIHNGKKIVVR